MAPPRRRRGPAPLLTRLDETRRILARAHERIAHDAAEGMDIGPAGEWFLDNYHVVQEHIREVRESLPRGYYRELPELGEGRLAGYPRVYEVAITLISHTEGRIDLAAVEHFAAAFQEVSTLSIGELWAAPAMLRLALLENVRRTALRTVNRLDETGAADDWADRILQASEHGPAQLQATLDDFVDAGAALTPIFVNRLLNRLRLVHGAMPSVTALEQWIADEGMSAEDAAARSTQRLALTQLMMSNSIMSLRAVAFMDWREFVERQSAMEAILRRDPSGFYRQMTFGTRDHYRHVVERIAKRTGRGEEEVAERAVALATGAPGDGGPADPRAAHVGFYLVDRGRADLERETGYRPGAREAVHRWVLRHPNLVLGGGIAVCLAGAIAAVLWLAGAEPDPVWFAVLLIAFPPAFDIAIGFVTQLITSFLPPRTLPKLDLQNRGIPEQYRTAVVVPTLFDGVTAVHEALENLEVQFLANREAHLHFAVLSDFADADAESVPGDAEVLAAAVDGVRMLNERYTDGTEDAFYLFHRPRRWNPQQGVWMGWERKRGKLGEFNRFLRGGAEDAFSTIVGNTRPLRQVRYVITLDSDTALPPDAAPALVGALAHPLNRAVYDETSGRVVLGYGILQPRVGVSLPSAHRSRFAAIQSGHPGVDPYTTAVSDVYQDLFGEGSFTGKGIYDVDAFERATHGRFPDNALLSHDLIEGGYARAGLATDVTVYDDYPARYLSFTRRKHRWIRGDWQLLPWLPRSNELSLLSRWKLFDNLRRSTVEISQLVFLLAGWLLLPGPALRWTLLGLGAIAAPWVISLLLAALRPPLDKSLGAYYAAVGRDAVTSAQQVAITIAFLPHQAWMSADAIIRTLWRLFVSRRYLLEWQTSSRAERAATTNPGGMWRAMWPAVLLGGGLLPFVVLAAGTGEGPPWSLALAVVPLAALWLFSPALAHALDAAPAGPDLRLRPAQVEQARRYAELHWAYFDRFATADTGWLVPDNYQDDPAPLVAMRTSPTNMGLQLLATVSACDLGLISLDDMVHRIEQAFRTLERLRRYRGHFYNWYDLNHLRVLEPAYVSTVDSGNLAGHLLAVRQACLELAADSENAALAPRLQVLAERAEAYVEEMDFGFLFDPARKLFAIGYNRAAHVLDSSYYDLLASEARLASFIAIAKNDVPVEHWFRLGRALTRTHGATALASWSGSMFEYLMPSLVMEALPYTLLNQTVHGAVRRQISYGAERGVPWGVSESAYNVRDHEGVYQYRAFGVPDLALKRGLARELVVAPYAAALALQVRPDRALANLAALEAAGALGPLGFRDALDYTRPPPGRRYAVVHNYMAHHVGMTLVALTNGLLGNVWQRRFHNDPLVRSAELLLHERIPRRLVLQQARPSHVAAALPADEHERPAVREIETPDTPQPRVALLGHLPYTIMVSHAGSGYSRYESLAVSRWRSDGTADDTGQFCYVKDLERGHVWSAAHQPTATEADWYRAVLATDRITFHRRDGDIETRTEIAVVPEDAAEIRRVTVTNNGGEARYVELTSYAEVVLAPPESERAHPAFANLFVETEWHEWCSAITASRRPRSAAEPALWCAHVVDSGDGRAGPVSCETDRARFVGRGRSTRDPIALEQDGPLSMTTGAVLDPVLSLRTRVHLEPGEAASVTFTTLVAETRERLFELAGRYHDPHAGRRALDLAWTSTQIEMREARITPADALVFQNLAGSLLYSSPALRATQEELERNRGSRERLWAIGVSGDWPIVVATIDSADGLTTLRSLLAAHRFWRRRGMTVDVVIMNSHPPGYLQELNDQIDEAIFAFGDTALVDRPGGIFVRRRDLIAADDRLMLRATARLIVPCDGRSLDRVARLATAPAPVVAAAEEAAEVPLPALDAKAEGKMIATVVKRVARTASHVLAPLGSSGHSRGAAASVSQPEAPLHLFNGLGGLTPGGDYQIRVEGDRLPPAPWTNVVANRVAGFTVTERGGGYTWAENSQSFRLTPWHNDPVSDPPTEIIYLRDEASGELWSATPAPVRSRRPYTVVHAPGTSTFIHERAGIESRLTLGMAGEDPVKVSLLRLTNRGDRSRRIVVTAYAEWTLGVLREHTQHQVATRYEPARGTMFARNSFDSTFAHLVAFCSMSGRVAAHTGDRREFLGRNGTLAAPAALAGEEIVPLSGAYGPALDPCAALQQTVELAPGATHELVVILGAASGQEEARRLVTTYRDVGAASAAMRGFADDWEKRLSVVAVRTPDEAFDAMVNRWALYQALGCRMWARSALYQSSGAYGFRDQLQDVMAFVYAEPGIAREHILRSASRQFLEGDVQHWWHPPEGRGVRTRFSDDLVWLPFVVDHYVRVTGDESVLDEYVPFLTMRTLEPDEHEVYDQPQVTEEHGSVYEHCLRALRRAATVGPQGLPLIGSGDWNDGMNRVGVGGRGESVWLAWFLVANLRAFAVHIERRGDAAVAADFRAKADAYVAAVEASSWDGAWYRRAYYDDGTPLGSAANDECRIDAIAQSWSVISGAGDPVRQKQAMQSLEQHLVRNDARLLMLLTPAFDKTTKDPGYIKGYLPGVRENGAQYTHAALWSALATAMSGNGDRAFELYQMINPLTHAATPEGVAEYKVEPYVVAADVYTAEGHLGRGGWTWYTGSASWLYRVGLESILGFRKAGDTLRIDPRVPAAWPEFRIDYRHGETTYAIVVQHPGRLAGGPVEVVVDRQVLDGGAIPLTDDGKRHDVIVRPVAD